MSLPGGGERSREVATAPASCKQRMIALPIPPEPPVTTAYLPASSLTPLMPIPPHDGPAYDDDRLPTKLLPARPHRWSRGGCGLPSRDHPRAISPAKPVPARYLRRDRQ